MTEMRSYARRMPLYLAGLLLFLLCLTAWTESDAEAGTRSEAAFSPHGASLQLILEGIAAAEREILVAGYSFTSKPIAEALLAAHKRGVLYIDTASHWESDVWYERMEADFPKHGIVRVKLCEILSASNNSGLPVEPSELAQILVARYRTARAEVLCLDSLESLFPTCTPQEHLEKFLALVESWQNTMSDPIVCCCAEGFFSNEAVDAFVDNRILVEDPRTPGGTFTEDNRRQFDTFISLPRVCLKVTVQKMVEAQYLEGKYFCYFLPDSSDMDPPGWRYFVLTERVQENGEDVFIEGNWSEVETTPEKAHDFLFRGISRADDE